MEAIRMNRVAMLYGDSLMKGTVVDAAYRYHGVIEGYLKKFKERFGLIMENRSRFGLTVDKGHKIVRSDIENGDIGDYAVVEYGGNDCNFKWNEISVEPEAEHFPLTQLPEFMAIYKSIIADLKAAGTIPILMTLPPIDAEKYFAFIERNGNDGKRILHWLHDIQRIYDYQESYSDAISRIAREAGTPIVDARRQFLKKPNYRDFICIDGLHPNKEGYQLIFEAFMDFAKRHLERNTA